MAASLPTLFEDLAEAIASCFNLNLPLELTPPLKLAYQNFSQLAQETSLVTTDVLAVLPEDDNTSSVC